MTTPSHIGQYRIVRKIGAGGMGLVFLGEHTLLGRRAAIKTLLPTVAANHEIVERFFNEARATSSIADPGVIQVFDFGYHVDGTAYIVMELLEGEALSARLERLGKLPLGDALRFARQIAGSLAAAHARDIIHRDLKPENIFLVRDTEAQGGERTKIIDFGICKLGTSDPMLTEVGAMIGTPVYMSPEQCRGSGEVDQRSDIYAFGCLLFHMLTGRPPFVGEASGDLIVAHLEEEPPSVRSYVPELPAAVDALLTCCLAKSPDERFVSMTAVQGALGELVVQAEPIEAVAAMPPPTVPLGRGFRSVYDANMNAWLKASFPGVAPGAAPGAPITHSLRARLRFDATPSSASDSGDHGAGEIAVPSRRAGVRAALACVLVVGVVIGLIVTPLILDGDDRRSTARASQPAALPIEREPVMAATPGGSTRTNGEPVATPKDVAATPAGSTRTRAEPATPAEAPKDVVATPGETAATAGAAPTAVAPVATEPAGAADHKQHPIPGAAVVMAAPSGTPAASAALAPASRPKDPSPSSSPRGGRESPRAGKAAAMSRAHAVADSRSSAPASRSPRPAMSPAATDRGSPRSTTAPPARPVTSPAELPAARPPPASATASPGVAESPPDPPARPAPRSPTSAPAFPAHASPPPTPAEDLYDTR